MIAERGPPRNRLSPFPSSEAALRFDPGLGMFPASQPAGKALDVDLYAKLLMFAALAQVALTFAVYVVLMKRRQAAVKAGLNLQDTAMDSTLWPSSARQAQANLANQYELPVLFFAGVAIAFGIGSANWLTSILALVFVGGRIWHAYEHLGANVVSRRGMAFGVGFVALGLFWLALAVPALLS